MSERVEDDAKLRQRRRLRDSLLISLTFATGIADALSYLGLGQIFTANMTGNTVFLAIAAGQLNVLLAARSGVAIAGFAAGAFVASRRLETSRDSDPWPRVVTETLYVELGFLVVFSLGWFTVRGTPSESVTYGLIAVSSVGMGMQSAVGRKLAVPNVSTNVLTMAMTGLMAELAAVGISGPNSRRWAAAILAMAGGAAIGGALFLWDRSVVPIPFLAVLAGVCIAATLGSREVKTRPPANAEG